MQPLATGVAEQEQKDVIVFMYGYSETVTHTFGSGDNCIQKKRKSHRAHQA